MLADLKTSTCLIEILLPRDERLNVNREENKSRAADVGGTAD